jgi:superfamily II DNA/RNA helicase
MDEVDRMLDMGFIEDVTRIVNYCPKDRQTLLFSATISDAIGRIAGWALRDPVTVDVRTGLGAADTVDHAIYPVDIFQKYDLLLALLNKSGYKSVIVFTRTKRPRHARRHDARRPHPVRTRRRARRFQVR